jgi:outer membrane protein TolC
MFKRLGRVFSLGASVLSLLAGLNVVSVQAQEAPADWALSAPPASNVYHITLEDAKQRALGNSKLRQLTLYNVQAKGEAVYVAESDYYPKVLANFTGFHFDNPLGKVLTPGILPISPIAVNVVNQDLGLTTVTALQPITALLKVRQAVRAADADQQIARSQVEEADRAIASGVEQLYCGLLAADKILVGARAAAGAAAAAQQMGAGRPLSIEAQILAVEGKQAIQAVASQQADLQEQLNGLLGLPLCTGLELVDLPPLCPTITCADQAINLALANSPAILQADWTAAKAEAGVEVAKVDWLPDVAVLGGYVNNDGINVIQHDVSYVALTANMPIFEGFKRIHAVRQAESVVAMARMKAFQTRDEVRLKARKAYREFYEAMEAAQTAQEMLLVRQEAQRKAATADDAVKAAGDLMKAQAAFVQAEATYRVAYAKLLNVAGLQ